MACVVVQVRGDQIRRRSAHYYSLLLLLVVFLKYDWTQCALLLLLLVFLSVLHTHPTPPHPTPPHPRTHSLHTGCGKSTLMLVLFRLLEPSKGALLIDGLDTARLGLTDLRSRLVRWQGRVWAKSNTV